MLLKSVAILANRPKIITIKCLQMFPNVKHNESAKILQFLLNISLKHKYTAKNYEKGRTTK